MRISDWSSDVCSSDLSPLSLAAYAAWVAVWLAAGGVMAGDPVVAWTLRIALVLFLLLFVFEHLVSERLGMRGFLAICAAMAALALWRSEEHTSELQSLMRISYAVFCLKKNKNTQIKN